MEEIDKEWINSLLRSSEYLKDAIDYIEKIEAESYKKGLLDGRHEGLDVGREEMYALMEKEKRLELSEKHEQKSI
jgi:hypothetical protein